MVSFSWAIQCRETPMFSTRRDFSSLRAFGFTTRRSSTNPRSPSLLIYKRFLSHVGKPFLLLVQIWDRNQFFFCGFRPISPKQFTQLPCRLALTLGECAGNFQSTLHGFRVCQAFCTTKVKLYFSPILSNSPGPNDNRG